VRAAPSASDFLRDPYGRYFVGRRSIIVYAHSPTLIGLDVFGNPSLEDIREMLALCEIELRPEASRHYFLADTRHCEQFDPTAFAVCVEWGIRNRHVLGEKVIRSTMLRTNGMLGAAITGFARVVKLPVMQQVFESEEEGIDWLGGAPGLGHDLFRELDAIRGSVFTESPLVRKLRPLLDQDGALSAAVAARRLGLSTRSLQRALEHAGTTYRQETLSFRMKRAKALLVDESRPVSLVAEQVGFASLQAFATAFRSAEGMTPTAWRRRAKAS
jgi:AraC-like DNA-binding protein